ncbi:uncharacterized protein LOC110823084 [Carica papaya]|uniref:uncharacterized protein LOC110823084 n=1 Tax=Carica papaya TaxID=3649 RepID=UPI000B8CBEC2|nr:uncharacterized protein LOC110823084 [Carica papaya]
MGNSALSCIPSLSSCAAKKHRARFVAGNGAEKVELEATTLAKDMSVDFSARSVSHGGHSSPYGLSSSKNDAVQAGGVKRIRLVLTKQQLQQLLTKEISLGQVITGTETTSFFSANLLDSEKRKPRLETIEEES